MGEVKQINIKNRTYYFYNDKKSYKNIGIYHTGYITIKKIDDCENINSMNPLYLLISHGNGFKYIHLHG